MQVMKGRKSKLCNETENHKDGVNQLSSSKKSKSAGKKASREAGDIKQGTIAKFMRKRTQLVGFETGLNKHTQYSIEFLDNAIDALESWWWRKKRKPRITDQLDPEIIKDIRKKLDGKTIDSIARSKKLEKDVRAGKEVEIPPRQKETLDERIKRFRKFLVPFRPLIRKNEPFAVLKLTEVHMPDLVALDDEEGFKVYEFTCFDNGIGMVPQDLEKFGIYLASSKSEKLRQTRGSQGFGAPSAFSDAQNTTGKPIFTVSKRMGAKMATVADFYTTTENTKDYVGGPKQMKLPFKHGTYVRLNYLNIQYRRGYADIYAEMASLLNSHVTIIFIDPYGEVHIYPRRVSKFPEEPKYAQPHPASIRIGEFQDLLRETKEKTVRSFLTRAFVRLSSNKAKDIIKAANVELGKRRLDKIKVSAAPRSLSKVQVELLYRAFSSEDYYAPPTDTVVPVGEEIFEQTIKMAYQPDFVTSVTRKPTSGKGLSFAIEVCIAYGGEIEPASSAPMVLWRFVNRVPKLRDNSDCATWKASTMVNWKNYKLKTFDNGIPRGPVMVFIHVCGAYVHVMFKGQSKQALAEDEVLLKEIKLALEEAGRKFRRYITRRETAKRKAKRAGILAMYADQFTHSLVTIANGYAGKEVYDAETLASKLRDAITGFETKEDVDETETDSKGSDLVSDVPLGEGEDSEGEQEEE
ncbi:DNA topoisomerase VI subunit B [Candidatus Thorarchaeota archaeon]|nr:MAG: DNA topoisomerase VI subunit B [Candidatus Thorarchaeota archaeon]